MLGLALVLLVQLWHYPPFDFMAPADRTRDRQRLTTGIAIYAAHR